MGEVGCLVLEFVERTRRLLLEVEGWSMVGKCGVTIVMGLYFMRYN